MKMTLIVVYTCSLTSSVFFSSSCCSFSEPLLDFCLKSVRSFRELTEGLFSSIVISSLPSSVSSALLNICDLNKGTHNGPQNSLSLCYHSQFITACKKIFDLIIFQQNITTCLSLKFLFSAVKQSRQNQYH